MSYSYAIQMELAPYPELSSRIADRFDLIILHELPYNKHEAERAINNCLPLLREGGSILVYLRVFI